MSFYANKDKRKELADLSEKVFGTRSRYQYFIKQRGHSIEAVEQQMRLLEQEIERIKGERTNEQSRTEVNNDTNTGISARRKLRIDRKTRRKILRARAKRQRQKV